MPATNPEVTCLRGRLWICLALVAATVAVYWPVTRFGFINFDDPSYVVENKSVAQGLTWPGIVWAFQTGHSANWHPLTWLSHMLDVQVFGLQAGPHHLVNLLFHVANTLLLFLVLQRMTGAVWRSAFVAGLFALHPLPARTWLMLSPKAANSKQPSPNIALCSKPLPATSRSGTASALFSPCREIWRKPLPNSVKCFAPTRGRQAHTATSPMR
jgi:hypothetical protein